MAAALPYISAAMSVVGGIQSLNAGKAQKKIASVKALQVQSDAEINQLNAMTKANEVSDNVRRTNATLIASAAAGNIDPNSGSAMILQQTNLAYAQKEMKALEIMKNRYKSFGDIQADILNAEGDMAKDAGMTSFLTSIGTAAGTMYKYGSGSGSAESAAPSYGMPGSGTPAYGSTDFWKGSA
tara:strand:+ start:2841 stop:3389 length:549 start_codon:yes stop_codon:yes gene_type:complete